MAAPTHFITINDFSPGIWSDFHSAKNTFVDGNPNARSFMPSMKTNGAAVAENTFKCCVDATGALIPLPARNTFYTDPLPSLLTSSNAQFQPVVRRGIYILDAQSGPIQTVGNLSSLYGDNASVHIMYGFMWASTADGATNGYQSYILGREYRGWTGSQPVMDFMLCQSVTKTPGWTPNSQTVLPLPAASLTAMRNYYVASSSGAAAFPASAFQKDASWPVMVAIATNPNTAHSPGVAAWTQGNIPAAVAALQTKARTPGTGVLRTPFDQFSPTVIPGAGVGGRVASVSIGMSWNDASFNSPPVPSRADLWTYHYNDNFFSNVPFNLPQAPYLATTFQGRLVMMDRVGSLFPGMTVYNSAGTALGALALDDIMYYSDVGLPLQDFVASADPAYSYYPANFSATQYKAFLTGETILSQCGAIGTVTNSSLLLVKHRGGGVLISGDLNNPTVRLLPAMESTHGTVCRGVQTPIGFVYGSLNGIFAWQGGDTSKDLSPQLDGFFWDHTQQATLNLPDELYLGSRGRIAYWNNFIFVPNSYCYDTRTESWWRLNNISSVAYNIYDESPAGTLLAFPYKVIDPDNAVVYGYFADQLSHDYSWQSQPLIESTQGRTVSVQNLEMRVTHYSGQTATIPVTLKGFDATGAVVSVSMTFNLTGTGDMQILRKDVAPNFQAEFMQITVAPSAALNNIPAPKVHEIKLGLGQRATTRRTG